MSHELLKHLLRPERAIISYSGSLSIPDSEGKRWSFGPASKVPVESTAIYSFFLPREEENHRQLPIKRYRREKMFVQSISLEKVQKEPSTEIKSVAFYKL